MRTVDLKRLNFQLSQNSPAWMTGRGVLKTPFPHSCEAKSARLRIACPPESCLRLILHAGDFWVSPSLSSKEIPCWLLERRCLIRKRRFLPLDQRECFVFARVAGGYPCWNSVRHPGEHPGGHTRTHPVGHAGGRQMHPRRALHPQGKDGACGGGISAVGKAGRWKLFRKVAYKASATMSRKELPQSYIPKPVLNVTKCLRKVFSLGLQLSQNSPAWMTGRGGL